jgi:hypothetical protein
MNYKLDEKKERWESAWEMFVTFRMVYIETGNEDDHELALMWHDRYLSAGGDPQRKPPDVGDADQRQENQNQNEEESEMYKKCHHCGDLLLDEEIYHGDAGMVLCPVCYCDLGDDDTYTYCVNCGDIITKNDVDNGRYFEADGGGLLCSECADFGDDLIRSEDALTEWEALYQSQ